MFGKILKLKQPDLWNKINIKSISLLPFSFLYYLGFSLKRLFVSKTSFKKSFVVAIGNVTVGGGGKTPTALWFSEELNKELNRKYKICCVSKGYHGSLKGPLLVTKMHSEEEVGDEALLLNEKLPTIISKDKIEGIKFAEEQGFNIIIVDDAFQTLKLQADFNILVIDGEFLFGNGFLLPAGPLREPVSSALKKANMIINIGGKEKRFGKPQCNAYIQPKTFIYEKAIAFSGIARPKKFFNLLKRSSFRIIKEISFSDHHRYTIEEIENLILEAKRLNAKLITTKKDWVRLNNEFKQKIEYIDTELAITNGDSLISIIKQKIDEKGI
ncbi:MAG: tetraacyldisaccharide 4'-kinase [Sphingobacteriia bacterium]|nr:tetraacyldisaccharide 4'-kinase [Sphingobacteriia bacterium]